MTFNHHQAEAYSYFTGQAAEPYSHNLLHQQASTSHLPALDGVGALFPSASASRKGSEDNSNSHFDDDEAFSPQADMSDATLPADHTAQMRDSSGRDRPGPHSPSTPRGTPVHSLPFLGHEEIPELRRQRAARKKLIVAFGKYSSLLLAQLWRREANVSCPTHAGSARVDDVNFHTARTVCLILRLTLVSFSSILPLKGICSDLVADYHRPALEDTPKHSPVDTSFTSVDAGSEQDFVYHGHTQAPFWGNQTQSNPSIESEYDNESEDHDKVMVQTVHSRNYLHVYTSNAVGVPGHNATQPAGPEYTDDAAF